MNSRSDASRQSTQALPRKMIGAGLLGGAAIGAIATARARGLTIPRDEPTTIADWDRVVAIATSMNKADALTMPQRAQLDGEYRALVDRCLPLVSSYMETKIESPVERTFAFDRVDWTPAHVDSFHNLLAPLSAIPSRPGTIRTGIPALIGRLNRQSVSAEMGM